VFLLKLALKICFNFQTISSTDQDSTCHKETWPTRQDDEHVQDEGGSS
jgi:hypothetical protein